MTWNIDAAHTNVEFAVRHMMIAKVRGRFSDVTGTIEFAESSPELSSVNVTIGVASVDTRNADRDTHLKSADFFDADTYPTMTFTSKRVNTTTANSGKVIGDLTIRGVTKEVLLDVTYSGQAKSPYGYIGAGFAASTTINRSDFGLTWNAALETGGVLVGEEVTISIEAEAIQQ